MSAVGVFPSAEHRLEAMASSDSRSEKEERKLVKLWEKCDKVYVNRDVFNKCLSVIKGWISIDALMGYLMAHELVSTMNDFAGINNNFLTPNQRMQQFLTHIDGCGRHGYFLLYVCLFESKEDQRGHHDVCDELKKKARELCVKAPWETRPVTTKAELGEGCLHQGETVERDKLPAALHQPAQVQNRAESTNFTAVHPRGTENLVLAEDDGGSKFDGRLLPYVLSTSKARGLVLIINNYQFPPGSDLSERKCGPDDGERLKSSFGGCGYRVRYEQNKSAEEIREIFDSLLPLKTAPDGSVTSDSVIHESDDSFVCCVISHGTWDEGKRQDLVYASDGECVSIQQLALDYLHVTADSNRQDLLYMKPKLFFVHACRGDGLTHVVADSDKSSKKALPTLPKVNVFPISADFLFSYPVVPGTKAYRDDHSGTFFIRRLCDAISDLKKKLDIVMILKRVHFDLTTGPCDVYLYSDGVKDIKVRHCPQLISTLRGPFFLTKDAEKKYKKYIK